jgi:inner membrane protein
VNRTPHMLFGAAAGAVVAHATGANLPLCMALGAFAGPLPDIDKHWSRDDRWVTPGEPCRLLDHRGPTHSLLAVAIVYLFFSAILPARLAHADAIALALAAGYFSHLVADGLSPMGEPFLWPIPNRIRLVPWRRSRVKSDRDAVNLPLALAVMVLAMAVR